MFRVQTKQHVHGPVDGQADIRGHDELSRSEVQIRQVPESARTLGHERSFQV